MMDNFALCLFSDLCGAEKIEGYPSIKYYHFGNYVVDYEKSRTSEDFISFFDQLPSSRSTEEKRDEL